MNVETFIEGEYFTHVRTTLNPSTVNGYAKLWRAYRGYLVGVEFDIEVYDAQNIMRTIYAANPHFSRTTLRHAKTFFSGVWNHARRMGKTKQESPWRYVKNPSAPEPPEETYAYSPLEIEMMLAALRELPGIYTTLVLLAACTGLRKSEIRGLHWSDWNSETSTLSVNLAMWRKHLKTPKTRASKAPVPVVPVLAARLREYRGDKLSTSFIFENSLGGSLDLDNVARRFIVPALGSGQWRGWHAFRRGLATFLHAQGVPDKEIQAVLRHANVSVTQKCYVRTVPENVRKAMATVSFGEQNALLVKSEHTTGGVL